MLAMVLWPHQMLLLKQQYQLLADAWPNIAAKRSRWGSLPSCLLGVTLHGASLLSLKALLAGP